MSHDLLVVCSKRVTVESVRLAITAAKVKLTLRTQDSLDLEAHSGGLPIALAHGRGLYEEAPDWSCTRGESPAGVVTYGLSCGADDAALALGWLLAASVATAGEGRVHDPQGDDDGREWFDPRAAWKVARAHLRGLPKLGADPEAAFVARLRRKGWDDARIARELDLWRPAHMRETLERAFASCLDDDDALADALRKRRIANGDELAFVLDLAWQKSLPSAARRLAGAAPPAVIDAHLLAAVRSVGLAARVYAKFLLADVGLGAPEVLARLRDVADADMRAVLDGVRASG